MIAVIADDFTGAAEIGGIGLKYGLNVIIETKVKSVKDADLLIIAADTRSMKTGEAFAKIQNVVAKLLKLNPEYIFKKLDSVLRGHIVEELMAQMEVCKKKRAIIVAANPSMGRIIKNGNYFINSVPLSETHFASDPEFPVHTSKVTEIIKSDGIQVVSLTVGDKLADSGLMVGNATNQKDLTNWASRVDDSMVVAGGSGFFEVLLAQEYSLQEQTAEQVTLGEKTLFVFGSTFPKSERITKRLSDGRVMKLNMPEAIYSTADFDRTLIDNWSREIVENLEQKQKVIISVEYNYSNEPGLSSRIKETMAELVYKVTRMISLNDLYIEGGATTSEILKSLKISKLYPCIELESGIIRMKVDEYPDLYITTKPGSYLWPESIIFENN